MSFKLENCPHCSVRCQTHPSIEERIEKLEILVAELKRKIEENSKKDRIILKD